MEPVLHGGAEVVQGDAIADFEEAVGGGEGVVEDRVVGEVAHGEAVEPLDGAGLWWGVWIAVRGEVFDRDFALEHGSP